MKERLWDQYRLTVLYIHFLPLYIEKREAFNKWFELTLQIFSLLSIIGLFKSIEHNVFFAIILSIITAVRFFKSYFITPEKEITLIKNVSTKYIENNVFLENLWYKRREKQVSELEVQEILDKYLIDELETISTHNVLKDKKLLAKAEELTKIYIETKFNYEQEG